MTSEALREMTSPALLGATPRACLGAFDCSKVLDNSHGSRLQWRLCTALLALTNLATPTFPEQLLPRISSDVIGVDLAPAI
jgi:hypothetical protein